MDGGSLHAEQRARPSLRSPVDRTRARPGIGTGESGGDGALVTPDEAAVRHAESLQRGERRGRGAPRR